MYYIKQKAHYTFEFNQTSGSLAGGLRFGPSVCSTHIFCNFRQIYLVIHDKYLMKTLVNMQQANARFAEQAPVFRQLISTLELLLFAIWQKYICQFDTYIFCHLRQEHFAISDKYLMQIYAASQCQSCRAGPSLLSTNFHFETNTFYNLRQIHFTICDKYFMKIVVNMQQANARVARQAPVCLQIIFNLWQIDLAIWDKYI